MWETPDFLELPVRQRKPRQTGLTHVLDKGAPTSALEAVLAGAGQFVDVLKIGWGTAYIDPHLKARVALCHTHGVISCLGGTLLEICQAQGRVAELRDWASDIGIDAVEVSNGMQMMTTTQKISLVGRFAQEFIVLAETGAKDASAPVVAEQWISEMRADLDAGASYVIAEGRESGTVGLYDTDGSLRTDLVESIAMLGTERVIFEAPRKAQQAELIKRFGPMVNIGNIALEDPIAVETLRLGLRADTAPRTNPARRR
ncbi:phosphosulfolactate synthase [Mycolicibacterium vinylchloridicum]|uniref:phosphosulfolactate synthase n=1 Tax=Mycolicibacterium vinylchloridicum TaxID=2736928 RepID=UPI00022E36AA|nr:phosphosulfolactate synthase [Mycolicibacterium vinylchloridicum]EHB46404.1 Phosphosulfolactate synthase [Mycolicibacterium rhodesiae JS60]